MRTFAHIVAENYLGPAAPAPWDKRHPRIEAEMRQLLRRVSDRCCVSGTPRTAQLLVQNALGMLAHSEVMPMGCVLEGESERAYVEWSLQPREGKAGMMTKTVREGLAAGLRPCPLYLLSTILAV